MAEAVTIVAGGAVSRRRSTKSETVSASALAVHLDCSRTYIGKLEAEDVIQRQGSGFALDPSRVACLRYCGASGGNRRAMKLMLPSPRKTEMLELRLAEKRRELVPKAVYDAMIDEFAGLVLTHLSGMAARCSNDLVVRRKIGAAVYEVRKEMAKAALAMADQQGELPFDQQG
jgi:hypothetical protein